MVLYAIKLIQNAWDHPFLLVVCYLNPLLRGMELIGGSITLADHRSKAEECARELEGNRKERAVRFKANDESIPMHYSEDAIISEQEKYDTFLKGAHRVIYCQRTSGIRNDRSTKSNAMIHYQRKHKLLMKFLSTTCYRSTIFFKSVRNFSATIFRLSNSGTRARINFQIFTTFVFKF